MADPFTIGGFVISCVQLASQWIKDYDEAGDWDEKDLPVDGQFVDVAIEKGVLEGPKEQYAFMYIERIPTAELRGSHVVILALNEEKQIKYRLVRGANSATPVALVKKLEAY